MDEYHRPSFREDMLYMAFPFVGMSMAACALALVMLVETMPLMLLSLFVGASLFVGTTTYCIVKLRKPSQPSQPMIYIEQGGRYHALPLAAHEQLQPGQQAMTVYREVPHDSTLHSR